MVKRPSYLSQPIVQRLPNLLREVQAGEIRVPRFQRPFVWKPEQRIELFRSIYDGIPIGSILIWRTRNHDLKSYDRLGPIQIDPQRRAGESEQSIVRQYLLDGHQRLTTLCAALGEGLVNEEPVRSQEVTPREFDEEKLEDELPIFFDLVDRRFAPRPRHGLPETWLPLSILLDPSKLYEFQKKLLEKGLDRTLINRAEALASTFKDYSIPVVPIVTEDLELATQSFQRVNSGGSKMSQVHMVSALTWSPEFDLNERMKEILVELEEVGWQGLEEQMILNVCKAALDLDVYYAEAEEIQKAIKDRPQVLEDASESLKAAAVFLRERCRVYGPAVLPYSFQVVLLADAIQRAGWLSNPDLKRKAKEGVERWFWLTTYTEHFAGISAGLLDRTLKHLRLVALGGGAPEPPNMSREVTSVPRRFDFRAARSRAIALRLAGLGPQCVGSEIHYPFQLLADFGREAMPQLIPSREVGARLSGGPENRILVHPREATALRRSLSEPMSHGLQPNLHASHAITEEAAQALFDGDKPNFIRLRREEIVALERTFVESLGLTLKGE